MRRIGLAVVLALSLTVAPLAAEARQAGKVYRVGVLSSASSIPDAVGRPAFLEGLTVWASCKGPTAARMLPPRIRLAMPLVFMEAAMVARRSEA